MATMLAKSKRRGGRGRRIAAWQAAGGLVHAGGLEAALFQVDAVIDPNNAGYMTVIDDRQFRRIRQAGFVYGAKIQVSGTSLAGQVKFKVFRLNGAVFDFVGESELFSFPAGSGVTRTHTFTFSAPLACQVGDCMGYATPESASKQPKVAWKSDAPGMARYVYADVQLSNAFAAVLAFAPCVEALTKRPYLAITGDSLAAGYTGNAGLYDTGAHDITHDPGYQVELLQPGLRYQNFASGGKSWDWVYSTSLTPALAVNPRVLMVHAGVNDAAAGTPWVNVQASMELVKAACDAAGVKLLVDELAPMTNQNDTVAAAMRALNVNYAAWCAANGVRLLRLHDEFGRLRASTGFLDDLLAGYEAADHAHFSLAGKQRLAQIWRDAL